MKIFSYTYFVLAAVASATSASPDDHPEGGTLRGLQGPPGPPGPPGETLNPGVNPECMLGCQDFFKNDIDVTTASDFCKKVVEVDPDELGECVSEAIALADEIGFPKSVGQMCSKCCQRPEGSAEFCLN